MNKKIEAMIIGGAIYTALCLNRNFWFAAGKGYMIGAFLSIGDKNAEELFAAINKDPRTNINKRVCLFSTKLFLATHERREKEKDNGSN